MKSKLLLVLLCLSLFSFAQDSTFQLKNYKYRTPGFRALSLNFYASGTSNTTRGGGLGKMEAKDFAAGPLNVFYYKIKSTERLWQQFSANASGYFHSGKNADFSGTVTQKLRNGDGELDVSLTNRYYKNSPWFFELGNRLQAKANYFKRDAPQPTRYRSLTAEDKLTIGVGKGRIEWVQDAQMALFILNDLRRQGLLDEAVTPETANAFAQLITDINNRRVFDTRRRRIYELTRIDSFLRSSGLAPQTDIRHFTTVNDNWAFAVNPFRSSGTLWYLRAVPGVGYIRSVSDYPNQQPVYRSEYSNPSVSIEPTVGIETYTPVSLKWQRNAGLGLSYLYSDGRSKQKTVQGTSVAETTNPYSYRRWLLNGFYGIGFFPNNRTQLATTLSASLARVDFQDVVTTSLTPQLQFSADYFLGYRSFVSAGFTLNYDRTREKRPTGRKDTYDTWLNSFVVQFTHYLF